MTELYPAFLNVQGRRCVVVGGGEVAERKVRALLASGASVTVVAPSVAPAIARFAESGDLTLRRRGFEAGDAAGALLVFAATDVPEVNAAVLREARAAGALVNVADDPRSGDFHVPAMVRRGDVVVAISTGGRSPSFARHLRLDLESWLTTERVELADLLAEVRRELQAGGSNPAPERWRQAVGPDLVAVLRAGDRVAARTLLLRALGAPASAGA